MGTLDAWLLIGVVFGVLWLFWRLMNLAADAFYQWRNAPTSSPRPKTGGNK